MSNEVLKAFIVSLGFKVDEAGAKKQQEAIGKTERAVAGLEKTERDAHAAGARRATELAQRAESMATAARIAGAGIVAFAAGAALALKGLADGLSKSLGEFDKLYYVAGRTGASVNSIKALGYAFEQTGSSATRAIGVLESFARARRTNPGTNALLKNYGVDTKGDASTVLGNAIDAISAKHPYFAGSQVAGILGISEEDFEHFTRYRKEIRQFEAENKALRKSLGLNDDETASAANRLARAFGSFSAVMDALSDKLTAVMAPVLERVVKAFRDWVAANPEKVEVIMRGIAAAAEAMGKALQGVLEWIGNDENQRHATELFEAIAKTVRDTAHEVRLLIDALNRLGKFLNPGRGDPVGKAVTGLLGSLGLGGGGGGLGVGAIGGASYLGQEPANDAAKPSLMRRGWNAVKRGLGVESAGNNSDRRPLGPVPQGLLDNIARAEGTYRTGYNTSLAHGRFLPDGKEHDLTSKSLNEIITLGNHMRRQPGNPNSSALGRYQIVGTTLRAAAKALGMDMETTKFNEATQDQMAHWIARKQGLGAWEGFKGHPAERAAAAAALARRDDSGGTRAPLQIVMPKPAEGSFARKGFNPSSFDVNAYLRSAPMGTSSTTNNQSSMNVNSPTNVTINGVTDPQKAAEHFERAANRSNDLMVRNVQAAAR
ncbi:glycoside hydrolase family 104 protein [Methylobacterium sp. WL6]|uniref:glycoside hydrolase family 104 protein n=1 Tax=Methylobacterium sp. WL6 TaxID=2603901 RepID=UPI0011CCB059|nr:glycoside hydrolase family 104 protein [Methylobacterium sp. WL6]TXN71474.1 glycoside hydrolase family 104 protein [Methylobacterium sp. WL6]